MPKRVLDYLLKGRKPQPAITGGTAALIRAMIGNCGDDAPALK